MRNRLFKVLNMMFDDLGKLLHRNIHVMLLTVIVILAYIGSFVTSTLTGQYQWLHFCIWLAALIIFCAVGLLIYDYWERSE